MKQYSRTQRTVSLTLAVILLLLALLPSSFSLCATEEDDEETTILACSDFQAESGNATGKSQVSAILDAMAQDGITSADGFFVCGDYDYE